MAKYQILFKHLDGSLKDIPGVRNPEDLCPRLYQVTEVRNGIETPILKRDDDHVSRITLFPEDASVELTDSEKALPKRVQERILERRSQNVDTAIQMNDAIRTSLKSYEDRGQVEIIDWRKELDENEVRQAAFAVTEMSAIQLADFRDRGIAIPDHFRLPEGAVASVDKPAVIVKAAPAKKSKSE